MRIRLALAAAALVCASAVAHAQETIKIAYIEGLSGPFANVGEMGLRHMQIAIETVNARGGVLGGRKFEAVPFDNKTSPQEALLAFKSAVGQGIRYIMQGNGSSVALALADAVAKHNERNPSQPVMFLNYAAVDPALTNERCTFGHFRFDADVDMKMQALTNAMAQQKNLRKVYLLNQDYSFGQAVARTARAMLAEKRPDVQIVGEDLHPLGKVKDFAPYVSKIKASGANAVVTGNWGNDLTLLVKAGKDAGLAVDYYTFYAGAAGAVTVIGEAGVGHVKQVTTWHANIEGSGAAANAQAYRARFPGAPEDLYYSSIRRSVEMLAIAMDKAKSASADRAGLALEGLSYSDDSGEVVMRADNHQLLQPLYVSTLVKAGGRNARLDVERTGLGFSTDARIEAADTRMPTTCAMQRPK
jgi:branched-chain amino acid transport system substrate-binding protein